MLKGQVKSTCLSFENSIKSWFVAQQQQIPGGGTVDIVNPLNFSLYLWERTLIWQSRAVASSSPRQRRCSKATLVSPSPLAISLLRFHPFLSPPPLPLQWFSGSWPPPTRVCIQLFSIRSRQEFTHLSCPSTSCHGSLVFLSGTSPGHEPVKEDGRSI